ncbi:6-bladed beta-propeller [Nitrosophilus alvini]|uniref:6-bladed beta-propeller n=1 Tax=Nitrosophilus alvini TaxID=2714855 RepID=UPI00190E4AB3|nr:6-bladed beta-propeller [Nitrosophilus alvini]
MKKVIKTILFLSLTLPLLAGSKPVWPQPPEKTRIAYEKSISKAEDLDIKKGFFAKIWDFFAGHEEKILIKPFGVHFDSGKIYVTDIGTRSLFIFDTKRKKLKIIEGFKSQKFASPIDVTTDKKGNIYVTDSMLGYVLVFDRMGNPLRKIGTSKKILRPTGIAYNKEKNTIYVTDTLSADIKIFTPEGKYISSIGGPGNSDGKFNRPTFITIDEEGNLYVSDSMNQRIQIFDKKGRFLRKFGKLGNTIGSFSNPRGVAVDKYGNIYVTDTLFHAVQIFNKKGDLLLVFGSYGEKEGEFVVPEDISITPDGTIYVTDSYNMRVQVFKITDYNDEK